ncbi:sterol 4-alpha-methyl-oxidase [Nannochloropsis gaditana]|uniref:Sterol 4-alpha-methyl-oxidase n=1 Tax=Nannochloropsis gaditana TaxID=72520 RepID=W7TJG2_9STRA|nr:sterol 4-alpha-methyl-oxidase [Nannochloropsis gaditana]
MTYDAIGTWIRYLADLLSRSAVDHGELVTFLAAGTLVHESIFVTGNLCYTLISYVPICRQRWKIQKGVNPSTELTHKAVLHIYLGRLFIQLPAIVGYFCLWKHCGGSMHASLPSAMQCTWQLLVCALGTEFMFYSAHRMFHHPSIYKYFHKQHHEFKSPIGISSEYAHVLEDLIVNLPSTLLPPVILGVHPLVLYLWLALRIWETVDAHSGLALPWSPYYLLPCFAGPLFHDFHHMATTKGAYGVLGLMDYIFGTDKEFKEHLLRRKHVEMDVNGKKAQVRAKELLRINM